MKVRLLLVSVLLFTPGCLEFGDGKKDAKIPGDELGVFQVVGKLDSSTCGPGALGSSDVWEFEVKLSRDDRDLYWLNGKTAIHGQIASDERTFAFDTRVEIEAAKPGPGSPGCVIQRSDSASGELDSAGADVQSFEGLLRFGFSPKAGGDCSPLIGVAEGFAALPCEMSYRLDGKRSAERK